MRFEIFEGGFFRRRWYWRLVAGNNEIIAQSEGYTARRSALDTIYSIRAKMHADMPIIDDKSGYPIPEAMTD